VKWNIHKTVYIGFMFLVITACMPLVALADSIGSFTRAADSTSPVSFSRTVVVCDSDVVQCNAKTPESDFEGEFTFTSSMFWAARGFQRGGADTVTLLTGPALDAYFTNGFPRDTVFIDASANGSATYRGFTLVEPTVSEPPPIPTPEPSTLELVACGLLGLGLTIWKLKPIGQTLSS
jgi:hypothetical protein